MNVADVLALKGAGVVTVQPTDSVRRLTQVLREKRIGAVVVSRDGVSVDGLISERDITYALAVHNTDLPAMQVSALMTKDVITCAPTDTLASVASTMLSRRFRHLPVVDGKRFLGMVSIRDVLSERVGELQQQTAMLRSLVTETARPPPDRD